MVNLDKKDYKILQALDADVRASYAEIGRKTRLSKEVVKYRIDALEKAGIITGYWTTPRIGQDIHVYKILLKNRSLAGEKKKSFIDFVVSNKVVAWFATTEGNWDFVISVFAEKDADFMRFVAAMFDRFGSNFRERHIMRSTSMITVNEKYLYEDGRLVKSKGDDFTVPSMDLDEKDRKILKMLSENARISFTEMGKNLKITPEAVSARFRKLKKESAIVGMNPRINHSKLGFSYYHLFISLSKYEMMQKVCSYYIQHPSCVFIMKHIGIYDLHLELVMKPEQFEAFIDDLAEKFGDIIAAYEPLRIVREHIMVIMR